MTYPARTVPAKSPVERKVTFATIGAYLGGLALMAMVNAVSSDPGLVGALPDTLEMFVVPVIPTVVAFLSGWVARHTPRPDLPAGGQVPHPRSEP